MNRQDILANRLFIALAVVLVLGSLAINFIIFPLLLAGLFGWFGVTLTFIQALIIWSVITALFTFIFK